MYKLLLVSDREDVLNAFEQVDNWERIGFKKPHIRNSFEGAKDSLAKHHADGIAIALNPEEKEKLILYLWEFFPYVPVFQAGTTKEEVVRYLKELKKVLNCLRADYSNEKFNEGEAIIKYRHDLFRRLLNGEVKDVEWFNRHMRLLRSRMDSDRPFIVMELSEKDEGRDLLGNRFQDDYQFLERVLAVSFSQDINGLHVFPLVTDKRKIFLVAGPLHGQTNSEGEESMSSIVMQSAEDGIAHVNRYQGIELQIVRTQVFPSFNALCH